MSTALITEHAPQIIPAHVTVGRTEISIVGLDMPFGQMVRVMVKLSFAAALASLITSLLWIVVGAVFVVIGGLVGTAAMTVLGLMLAALSQA